MKIRLDPVVDRPFDWQETLAVTAADLDHPDLQALGDVSVTGRISPMSEGYLFEAKLSALQTLRCTRCLEDFEQPMATEVRLMIEICEPHEMPAEVELVADDLGVLKLVEPEIETEPLWREQLHLALPMKPLCRDDCAGLCSSCGADLNEGACGCGPAVDPRWAALQGLGQSEQ